MEGQGFKVCFVFLKELRGKHHPSRIQTGSSGSGCCPGSSLGSGFVLQVATGSLQKPEVGKEVVCFTR